MSLPSNQSQDPQPPQGPPQNQPPQNQPPEQPPQNQPPEQPPAASSEPSPISPDEMIYFNDESSGKRVGVRLGEAIDAYRRKPGEDQSRKATLLDGLVRGDPAAIQEVMGLLGPASGPQQPPDPHMQDITHLKQEVAALKSMLEESRHTVSGMTQRETLQQIAGHLPQVAQTYPHLARLGNDAATMVLNAYTQIVGQYQNPDPTVRQQSFNQALQISEQRLKMIAERLGVVSSNGQPRGPQVINDQGRPGQRPSPPSASEGTFPARYYQGPDGLLYDSDAPNAPPDPRQNNPVPNQPVSVPAGGAPGVMNPQPTHYTKDGLVQNLRNRLTQIGGAF